MQSFSRRFVNSISSKNIEYFNLFTVDCTKANVDCYQLVDTEFIVLRSVKFCLKRVQGCWSMQT